jgi:hypothetical protein
MNNDTRWQNLARKLYRAFSRHAGFGLRRLPKRSTFHSAGFRGAIDPACRGDRLSRLPKCQGPRSRRRRCGDGRQARDIGQSREGLFPRTDVPVSVDGWNGVPPFMGLTSWAAFTPGEKAGVESMVMGDLVLFEDEVNPAMSAALDNGIEVTALHNHFFYDKPHVFFMHIGGEGSIDKLGKGVKVTLDAVKAVRQKTPQPHDGFGAQALETPSKIDGAKLDAVFGVKGATKDGMYKAVMGRTTTAACGCSIGKAMGVNTWAAFAGSDDNAAVDGDFAVAETELQPVLRALRHGGINIVAIHHHMTDEKPRILFLHYWGRGKASDLGRAVRQAIDLTDWEGKRSGA